MAFFMQIKLFTSLPHAVKNLAFYFHKDIDTQLILWFNVCRLLVYFC